MGQQGRFQRRGPKGYTRSDDRIKEDICEQLMQSAYIDASEIAIEVRGGRVTLEGSVPERRMKHAVEDLADSVAGVNDVENKIRVSQSGGAQSGSEHSGNQSRSMSAEGSSGTSGSSSFGSNAGGSSSSDTSSANTASRGPGSSQTLAGQSTSSSSTAKPARE